MEKIKNRDSNIELYRIVLMLLIIAHHYVVNSGVVELLYANPINFKSVIMFLFGAWGKIGINCFILITGFFMCKSNISIKKFLKLLFEVEFYNIIIYILMTVMGINTINFKQLIKAILPIQQINTNFTGCFLAFYLFIPFINILIKNMNKKEHFCLIGLMLFVYSILGTIPRITVVMNYISLYFMIYLIGAYIRLYRIKLLEKKRNIKIFNIVMILLVNLSVIIGVFVGYKVNKKLAYYFVNDSNKIIAVASSIALFLRFKNINLKYNKIINQVAKSVFGVLCIHANSLEMIYFLWYKLFKNTQAFQHNTYLLHAIISVILVFAICTIIDQIRIKLIEEPVFKKIDGKLEAIQEKFEKYIQE